MEEGKEEGKKGVTDSVLVAVYIQRVEIRIKLAVKDYFNEKLNGTCDIIFSGCENSFL